MARTYGTIPRFHISVNSVMACVVLVALHGVLGAQDLGQVGQGKPLHVNGSISLQGGPYFYSGDGTPRNQPWFWNANGNATLSLYGWNAPFSFSIGSQERTWTQPFNRYGVSPYYKWVRLHLGYRSMRFNPFTFSGLQFFGGGVELDPKGFRFAAFYGRFNKPVAQDTLASITPVPAYRRMGFGVKIGAGNPKNFVDLMLFRAWDDTASIVDPTAGSRVTPKENTSVGLSGRLGIGRHFSWQLDLGASALTDNVRAPLNPGVEVPRPAVGLFSPRFGSKALFAGSTALAWTDRYFNLRLQYKQVEPDYRSLGAFYQQTDVRSITVEPSVRLMKSKLRLGGSIGRQQDNLNGKKSATSIRNIGSANMSWQPTRSYGLDINFSNYGVEQEAGLRVLNDTFRVAQVNRSYMIAQRLMRTNKLRTWAGNLSMGMQQLMDLNPFSTFNSAENEVLYGNLHVSRIRHRDNLSVSGGLNFSRNQAALGESILVGPMVGLSRSFAGQKVTVGSNCSWNKALQDGNEAGNTLNVNANLQYRHSPAHRFQLSVTALQNRTSFVAVREFTEVRMMGGYVYVFQPKT